jgi:hypothetical protein
VRPQLRPRRPAALLHVTSRGAAPGPENDPRALCLTRWDGHAWQTGEIAGPITTTTWGASG